ncbi:MAG: C_GCAxxG_C_C family protein [Ruminococcaceae bacterium]|nr:C_GCAxxG_C_C family protein [Oscillospiraceae bacterium]
MGKLRKTPEEYREEAEKYFVDGFNCAQSVFLAFAEELGLDGDTALKISSSFGGGMGRLREVCGAVSGMFMVLGMRCGYTSPEADSEKAELYRKVQELAGKFKEENQTIICRELLDLRINGADSHKPEVRTPEYYKNRPCAKFVGDAAYLTAKFVEENG